MPFRSESAVGSRKSEVRIGLVFVLLLAALPASAAERSASDVVLVDEGAVIPEDLYAAGNRVVIAGRVEGDLIVAAYEDVTITGTVAGDVLGLAGSVVVPGTIGESLRVVSPRIDLTGQVGGDVLVVGWNVRLAGEVAGEAVVWGWDTGLSGTVDNLEGQMRRLDLGGTVEGNVDVTVGHLTVSPGAQVRQDLGYRSDRVAAGIEEAAVGGSVVHRLPLPPNIRIRALMVLAKVVLGLMAAVVGLLVMWALPAMSQRAAGSVTSSWWRSWLRGLAVMLSPLVMVALSAALVGLSPTEAALPLIGVLLPLFVAVLGLVTALAFIAPSAVYPGLGRLGNRRRGPVRAFLYGAGVVIAASLIPWLIWPVLLFVVPVGIGGWVAPAAAVGQS